MKSLKARLLLLVVGFGLATAALLALIMYSSVRQYYSDWVYDKSSRFAERVVEVHPELWDDYLRNPGVFGLQLRQYMLYTPRIDLYLLDTEGRILASAEANQPFWETLRIDLRPVRIALRTDPDLPIYTTDPERQGALSLAAARPVIHEGTVAGWLFVVPRQVDLSAQMSEMLRSYAVRTAAKVGAATIAIGVLITLAMITLLTRPLTLLTRATEQVRNSGFNADFSESSFPGSDRDDEIGRLSRTFGDALGRLKLETERVQTIDEKRREMVASVSHDLRTPLTALMGQLETIRLKHGTLSEQAREQLLERALHNAQHLRRLTDALADLARFDSPDFHAQLEPIAIGELADDVAQRFATRAQESGITLDIDYPDGLPLAPVDAALIERALANLLDNALRVTPAGGHVLVRVRREASDVRLEVIDTGPGVAPEDESRVFEPFFQSSSARDNRGSSGLGLAVVRRVAELHGGRVGLKTEPGHGSTFYIDLPLSS